MKPASPKPGSRARENWRGASLIALSVLALGLCVCATAAVSLVDRVPRQIDRYLMTRTGEVGLYGVTYADDSTGWLTVNVAAASTDSLSYAAVLGEGGRAVQINYHFTNWQGSGETYTRVDTLARQDNRLLLLAQQHPDRVEFLEPPIETWSPALLRSSAAAPVETATTLYGQDWTLRAWLDGEEPWTLPDGRSVTAQRFKVEWQTQGEVLDTMTTWYVPGVGEVRYEEVDDAGNVILTAKLVTNSRLDYRAAAAVPWEALVETEGGETALFREGLDRTGAWPEAALGQPELRVIYRRQGGVGITASPVYAQGLFFVADQSGRLQAVEAYGAAPRWQFTAGGPIVAAPAVAGVVVYVGAADKHVYALEAREGHYLWRHGLRDNVSTAPAVLDGVVYVGAEDRTLYALDARTGEERWHYVAGDRIVSSPAVADGRVIFGADDGVVYALDAAAGNLLWRYALDSAVVATPAIGPNGVVFAASDGQQLAALEAASGRALWTVETRFGYLASPAAGPTHVYTADIEGNVAAYAAASGERAWLWDDPADGGFVSSPLLVGGHLLAVNTRGQLHVWEAETGARLHTVQIGDGMTASPTWTGEAVLLANAEGDLLVLSGDPTKRSLSLTQQWQGEYGAGSEFGGDESQLVARSLYADPLPVGERLYVLVRGGELWAVDPATGVGTAITALGEEAWATPAEREGTLYAVTVSGQVNAIDLRSGDSAWETDLENTTRFGPAVDETRVYVHTLGAPRTVVSALDRATGEVVWEQRLADGNATPVLSGNHLLVAGAAITALDPATGEVRWESEPLVALGTLGVFDGVAYGGDGDGEGASFLAVDAATGATLWRREDEATYRYGRPAFDAASDLVMAGTQEGRLYAFEAATGELRWRFQADSALQSTLLVRDGVVFFTALSGSLYAVETGTGRLLNHFRPGTNINTLAGPALAGDQVFTAHGTTLYALHLSAEGRP